MEVFGLTTREQITVMSWAERWPLLIPTRDEEYIMLSKHPERWSPFYRLSKARLEWLRAGGSLSFTEAEAVFLRPKRSFRMPQIRQSKELSL